jgi:DNA-binding NarL/FixJ family response regulator
LPRPPRPALRFGASRSLVKNTEPADLGEAVRIVAGGEALISPGMTRQLIAEFARRLVLSPATARTHVSRVITKLGARDRAQLVVLAYETGLVRPGWTV